MRILFAITLSAFAVACAGGDASAGPKSALDHFQFDGVMADDALKDSGWTRRHWIEQYPVQAKEYWRAWDCKGKPCDSTWQAQIRAKAKLIARTPKDPSPASNDVSSSK